MNKVVLLLAGLCCTPGLLHADAFWRRTDGPYGGGDFFAIFSDSTGRLFAAAAPSGVFRSTDGGASWREIRGGLEQIWVNCFATGPGGDLFAGTTAHGVFRSKDGGDTWHQVGLEGNGVRCLVFAADGSFFAGGSGIYRTRDGGDSWVPVNQGLTNPAVYGLGIATGGALIATTWGGPFRSTNGGDTWEHVGRMMNFTWSLATDAQGRVFIGDDYGIECTSDAGDTWTRFDLYKTVFALAADSRGDVFAGTDWGGVYRSRDAGGRWDPVNTGLVNTRIFALAASDSGSVFAGTLGGGIFRSENRGDSWRAASNGLYLAPVTSLASSPSGRLLAGSRGGGVFATDDGGAHWGSANQGFASAGAYALTFVPGGRLFAGAGWPGYLFRSDDDGASWTASGAGVGVPVIALSGGPAGRVYCGTPRTEAYWGGLFQSSDHGESWSPIGVGNETVSALAFVPPDHLFVSAEGGLVRTLNGGGTWERAGEGLPRDVWVLVADPGGWLYAGTDAGGVYRSKNDGGHWSPTTLTAPLRIRSIAVNSVGDVFAGGGGVYRSTDRGETWTRLDDAGTAMDVTALTLDERGYLYAGTLGDGVFASVQSTVPVEVYDLSAVQRDGDVELRWRTAREEAVSAFRVYRSRSGGPFEALPGDVAPNNSRTYSYDDVDPSPGRYTYRVGEVSAAGDVVLHSGVDVDVVRAAPRATFLDPCTPNPFNPTTSMRFGLARSGPARLAIYDARGRLVRGLLAATRERGFYLVTWDGRDDRGRRVASGSYRVRLEEDSRFLTRSVTLVK